MGGGGRRRTLNCEWGEGGGGKRKVHTVMKIFYYGLFFVTRFHWNV